MEARHYIIMGKVQGVGYRFFVQNIARELALVGWVQNMPDGNVECAVMGNDQELEIFEKKIRKGPPLSRVVNMQRDKLSPYEMDPSEDFEIRQ
ncbi:MAG: acylphosphatase [Leptospirales bacterium]